MQRLVSQFPKIWQSTKFPQYKCPPNQKNNYRSDYHLKQDRYINNLKNYSRLLDKYIKNNNPNTKMVYLTLDKDKKNKNIPDVKKYLKELKYVYPYSLIDPYWDFCSNDLYKERQDLLFNVWTLLKNCDYCIIQEDIINVTNKLFLNKYSHNLKLKHDFMDQKFLLKTFMVLKKFDIEDGSAMKQLLIEEKERLCERMIMLNDAIHNNLPHYNDNICDPEYRISNNENIFKDRK